MLGWMLYFYEENLYLTDKEEILQYQFYFISYETKKTICLNTYCHSKFRASDYG